MGVFTRSTASATRASLTGAAAAVSAPAQLAPVADFARPRVIRGSARALDLRNDPSERQRLARRGSDRTSQWQAEAWDYYDDIGEVKYAFSILAAAMSRLRLTAAQITDPGKPPTPLESSEDSTAAAGAAMSALASLNSAFGGQSGLLRDATLNLCVPGECYLVQIPGTTFPTNQPDVWNIISPDEFETDNEGNRYIKNRADMQAGERRKLPTNAFVARIWRPHPRYSDEPDSSMRGVLDACAELTLINKTFRSTARSRLNAGLLYVPDGLSVSGSPDPESVADARDIIGDDEDFEADPDYPDTIQVPEDDTDEEFEESLIEAMSEPIADESAASAVVPLLIRGPADLGDKIKQFSFSRAFDEALTARCDRVLERIMQGIDIPKELVKGIAEAKYANAVVIDDALFKSHIEPLALLLCDALTVAYLRPAMRANGITDTSELNSYVIWFDSSDVTNRPNKAQDADSGFANHLLSGSAWRRAHGFSDEDAPTGTETVIRMLVEKGGLTPELTEALLNVIAPEAMAAVRQASQASNPAPLPDDVASALGIGASTPAAAEPAAPSSPATPPADSRATPPTPSAPPGQKPVGSNPAPPKDISPSDFL